MLGRQQIAGIPTAISELFKNAHDAYADTVEADFFRSERLFVVRDDGVGMTYDEFVNNWLTLATDVKVAGADDGSSIRVPSGKERRRILGEKGIGRLAIAAIGPQVLVLTRSARNNGASELVAAFINWDLFRLPGIDLNEIEVPIRTFPPGAVPTKRDLDTMIYTVKESLKGLRLQTDSDMLEDIQKHLDQFDFDERLMMELGGRALSGQGQGTQFYIQPTDETLELDIDGAGNGKHCSTAAQDAYRIHQHYDARDTRKPVIKTAFRDHKAPAL